MVDLSKPPPIGEQVDDALADLEDTIEQLRGLLEQIRPTPDNDDGGGS